MYIVFIKKEKHSIWNTKKEAIHQCDVLIDAGYDSELWIDEVEADYSNGFYFV